MLQELYGIIRRSRRSTLDVRNRQFTHANGITFSLDCEAASLSRHAYVVLRITWSVKEKVLHAYMPESDFGLGEIYLGEDKEKKNEWVQLTDYSGRALSPLAEKFLKEWTPQVIQAVAELIPPFLGNIQSQSSLPEARPRSPEDIDERIRKLGLA